MPRTRFLYIALLSMSTALFACGGGASPSQIPAPPTSGAPKETPAENTNTKNAKNTKMSGAACIELATAKREQRKDEPSRISVKHILVRYAGSKSAGPEFTRNREEACLRAIEARDEIRAGADFVAMVEKYSDEPGAASRQGSVGGIERSMVVAPFADAAFELDLGQLSDVVETDFGFHVILRTE